MQYGWLYIAAFVAAIMSRAAEGDKADIRWDRPSTYFNIIGTITATILAVRAVL